MKLPFHKILIRIMLLGFLFGSLNLSESLAQTVSFSGISVSNSNPTPGSVVGVTVTYCDLSNQVPYFYVALNPTFASMQPCPAANQILLLDKNTTPTGVSPINSTTDETNDGGKGWIGVNKGGAPTCPITQIFNVTIPPGQAGGAYNLIVEERDYYVACGTGANAVTATTVNIPLPAAALTVTKSAATTVAAPDSLILFNLNYTYVNTSNVIL